MKIVGVNLIAVLLLCSCASNSHAFLGFTKKSSGARCDSLFKANSVNSNKANEAKSVYNENIGYHFKPTSLEQAYVNQSLQNKVIEKKYDSSVLKRFSRFIKNLFMGRESQDQMEIKFGKNWEGNLSKGVISLKRTRLTDLEFREIINWLKNNRELSDMPLSFNLEGNAALSTRVILELLNFDLIIRELNLHGTSVNTSSVVIALEAREKRMISLESKHKARGKYGIRKLTLDNISDADLVVLSGFRQLRELNLDNSLLVSSTSVRFRSAVHKFIEIFYSGITRRGFQYFNTLERNAFYAYNYVTVAGIKQFVKIQKGTTVKNRQGSSVVWNPNLSKIVIPVIRDKKTNKEVSSELGILFVSKDERLEVQHPLAALDVKLEFAGSSRSVIYKYTYDGDTIWVWDSNSNDRPLYSIRLNGIDTFELKSTNAIEQKIAIAAKNFTAHHLKKADEIRIFSRGDWHHGRKIADIVLIINNQEFFLNQELVIHGLALPYFGQTNTSANKIELELNTQKLYAAFKNTINYWYNKY